MTMAGGGDGDGTVLMSKPEFARWLRRRVDERTPAAVVRFNDGEGRLLTADPDDTEAMKATIRKLMRETGQAFPPEAVLEVKALVALAYDEADVLGIRFGDQFVDEHKTWMNRLATLYAERVAAGRPAASLAPCLLNYDILDALPEVLAGRRVSVISCRDVKPVLEAGWGLDDVAVYQVPSQYMVRDVDGAYEARLYDVPIWPDVHARLHSELTVRERGEVFLVGAGLFGKDLCIRIRDQGGIALDMGSALDRVAGKVTRGPKRRVLDLYASGMPVPDIASHLQNLYGVQVEPDRISRGMEEVFGEVATWRGRPLEAVYPIVYFEALQVEVTGGRSAKSRTCYLALGESPDGNRDPLGIWWRDAGGVEFWRAVLTDLHQRGVRDMQIACVDDPQGLTEAIGVVFPRARVQTTDPIEACTAIRKAIETHGHFTDQQAATTLICLALTRAEGMQRKARHPPDGNSGRPSRKLGTLRYVQEAEVDLERHRVRLAEELGEAQREERRLGRRLETLDREAARRTALVATLAAEVERTAGSRSFRFGHGILRRFSRWVLRRPARRSALGTASELLEEARRDLGFPSPVAPPAGVKQVNGAAARPPVAVPPSEPRQRAPSRPSKRSDSRRATRATANEEALRSGFRARYEALFRPDGTATTGEHELSGPLPRDRRAMLVGSAADSEPEHPGADVVVCVRDAPEDVRACLWSLLHSATRPFHLIVVDDGSGPETAAMLDALARREPEIELIRNKGPEHGYTRAANIGLGASTGAHVVLLNSDTIVSPHWLERIVACLESDKRIGVVGPLSNAATHQSVPAVKEGGRWAVNELPPWMTVDSMALLLAELSGCERPRVPFVNGFCYAMTREAIDRVGLFDEERFGSGYCEENDFSIRARDAGFLLALADDAYVFHGKSKSYTRVGRDEVARPNYELFLEKHGAERVQELLAELDEVTELESLREATQIATAGEQATIDAFRAANPKPLEVLFVLHGMPEGSGGGVHSIYQETTGLRRLGVPARIAIAAEATERARAAYPDAEEVFVPYSSDADVARIAATADVVVATHFSTVALIGRLHDRHGGFLPAYYAQDYEPFFAEPGSSQLIEALDSYTAVPGQLVFAKTHWLRNLIGHLHGIDVAKVEPSVDGVIFSTEGRSDRPGGPVRVAAMIRPRTPRRQPVLTLDALSELTATHGDGVEVTTFGCSVESVEALGRTPPGAHLGLLTRHQVADLLKRTDIFLDASTYQAFGRTAIEAMACGCTAIAPQIGGAAQFVRHEENGLLVDTLQPEAVHDALERLVEDDDLRRRLQAGSVEEARHHSVLRAALSEYALFARERDRRLRPPARRPTGEAA